ncbi:MAG: serine hydrolase domain-containing protein, partial [Verrucomicrobiales bacterium]
MNRSFPFSVVPALSLLLITGLSSARAEEKIAALDPARLARIPEAMTAEIAAHHAAGTVTLVMQDGKILHQAASGMADRETGRPMATDSVFWIASMTKSISASTILTLVDEGKLTLDEPASRWIPELEKAQLADGTAVERPITLRDLMSHTSGLAFPPRKPTDGAQSLKGYVAELVKAPLAFQPGSAYEYGFGLSVAGRIAEISSGQSFEALVQARILDPLGMKDTSFHPDERLRARFAKTYKTAEDSSELVPGYNPFVTPDPTVRHMTEPSGGLFSTAADLAAFYRMILE